MNPAEMIADWTEVVLVNKRSWTMRLSVRKFLKQPFWTTARLTHFTKLSSWKQSLSFTYYTRIHRVAVEFLRNRARSNLGITIPVQNKSQDMLKSSEPIFIVHFPSHISYFHHVCFKEWTFVIFLHLQFQVSLDLWAPQCGLYFPESLCIFSRQAYLQVLLQFQPFSNAGKNSQGQRKIRRYINKNTDFFLSKLS